MTFNAQILGIPQELFELVENSIWTKSTTKRAGIENYKVVVYNGTTKTYTTLVNEKYIKETAPLVNTSQAFALNFVTDVLSTYEYLGFQNGKMVFLRPGYVIEDPNFNNELKVIPDDFITIEITPVGETYIQNPAAEVRFDEVKKLPSGEWITVKDWTNSELLNLKFQPSSYKGIGSSNIPTRSDFNKFGKLTETQLNELLQFKNEFVNSSDPKVVRHIFNLAERVDDTITFGLFVNGKTNAEVPFTYYNKPGALEHFPVLKGQFDVVLYNETPINPNATEQDILAGINNMGQTTKVAFKTNLLDLKTIKVIATPGVAGKYDAATNTIYYDSNKESILRLAFNEYNVFGISYNGKQTSFEYYLNLNSGVGSPAYFKSKLG